MIPRLPGEGPRDLSKPLEEIRVQVPVESDGARLDQTLQQFLHWRSRNSIHRLIKGGYVLLTERSARPSRKVQAGEVITVRIPQRPEPEEVAPGDFDLPVLFEDRYMIAVDKPPGLAVHPAGKRVHGTLIHHLHKRYRRPDDPAHDVVPRLMHRLDRETSGVVAIGLDEQFHSEVAKQFEDRQVSKTYLAVVHGRPADPSGLIDFGIGPDKRSAIRLKLAAHRDGGGMPALTQYKVISSNARYSLVELLPKTGRTHQLRVHMSAIGCPLVGDKIYGLDENIFLEQLEGELSAESRERLVLSRHALHAHRLRIYHPRMKEELELSAELPADMRALID
ncbi:MAG: RluA family pseudouridine synthase [Planctomycetota bacterium]|jgi:23S rRNA pseudouridine1911/1915/1917 synthase